MTNNPAFNPGRRTRNDAPPSYIEIEAARNPPPYPETLTRLGQILERQNQFFLVQNEAIGFGPKCIQVELVDKDCKVIMYTRYKLFEQSWEADFKDDDGVVLLSLKQLEGGDLWVSSGQVELGSIREENGSKTISARNAFALDGKTVGQFVPHKCTQDGDGMVRDQFRISFQLPGNENDGDGAGDPSSRIDIGTVEKRSSFVIVNTTLALQLDAVQFKKLNTSLQGLVLAMAFVLCKRPMVEEPAGECCDLSVEGCTCYGRKRKRLLSFLMWSSFLLFIVAGFTLFFIYVKNEVRTQPDDDIGDHLTTTTTDSSSVG